MPPEAAVELLRNTHTYLSNKLLHGLLTKALMDFHLATRPKYHSV